MVDMRQSDEEENRKKKLHRDDSKKNLHVKKQIIKPTNEANSSSSKKEVSNFSKEDTSKGILKKITSDKSTAHKTKTPRKQHSSCAKKDKPVQTNTKDSEKTDYRDVKSENFKRRRRKKRKHNGSLDEASRLQRRTRYLLIRIKLEQNLIDAYSTEGWKGQSREKIKPEQELHRAKKQILKCKLGIREAVHQLDSLSSVGARINDSKVAPDGSVHHEHIICAKCNLREALPDNDIILCDGTCNRAFHQKCIDPPLSTNNIPPEDEGWFCKFCKTKIEVLEATNAHLGTHFSMDCNWQDVFKEEALISDDGNSPICPEQEWPSDDSNDDDYDPERIEDSCSCSGSLSTSDASDYTFSNERIRGSFDNSIDLIEIDSHEINGVDVLCRPRQRAAVDYTKLYDEMFGKNAPDNEPVSEDEDWGPTKRRRKGKETDAATTLMSLGENEKKDSEENQTEMKSKRPILRLPPNATEKLRLVFAENELPNRALRESLSKQLGLEFEKVNKWFKNARYLALKVRKAETANLSQEVSPGIQQESSFKKYTRRKNVHLMNDSFYMKQPIKRCLNRSKTSVDFGDNVSLKLLKEKAKEAKKKNSKSQNDILEAEAKMEKLSRIKERVEKLQQILLQLPNRRFGKNNAATSSDPSVFYVPIAEVREKR